MKPEENEVNDERAMWRNIFEKFHGNNGTIDAMVEIINERVISSIILHV